MNESISNPIRLEFQAAFPTEKWHNHRTLVAVSGGPDSVALLRLFIEFAEEFSPAAVSHLIVAHVNHGIRGDESQRDRDFVSGLALRFGLKFVESDRSLPAQGKRSEENLRDFRYQQLSQMAAHEGARYVAMGHNRDDQVETILFRILRGTGISGLAGIPQFRLINDSVTVVRPLLSVPRAEIEGYLTEIGQPSCEDSSNRNVYYTRNFLRNDLLPTLNARFENDVAQAVTRLGIQAGQTMALLNDQCRGLKDSIASRGPNHVELIRRRLESVSPVLIRQFLSEIWIEQAWSRQAMTFEWWDRLAESFAPETEPNFPAVCDLPGGIRLEKTDEHIRFSHTHFSSQPDRRRSN